MRNKPEHPATSERHSGPLNCPKGNGLCYGCKVWCDHPQARELNQPEVSQHDVNAVLAMTGWPTPRGRA